MTYLRNNKILLLIIAALIIINLAVLYFKVWNKPKQHHRSMREVVIEKLKKDVGFSDQQIMVYDSIRTLHFKSMEPMFSELKSAKEKFYSLVNQENVSDSVINNYSKAISDQQKAIDAKMLKYFISVKALCTEVQRPKMDTFLHHITKRIAAGPSHRPSPSSEKK